MEECASHSEHVRRITRNENDIQKLFQLDSETSRKIDSNKNKFIEKIDQVEEHFTYKFDGMKNMIIAGLGGTALQLIILIISIIFAFFKFKGA